MPIVVRNLETGELVRSLSPVNHRPTNRDGAALAPTSCCGGAAPGGTDACCALDAEVKASGGSGCGCGTTAPSPKVSGCC